MDEVREHNAEDMKAYPAFQELKSEQCVPPVLQAMFEKAGRLGGFFAERQEKQNRLNLICDGDESLIYSLETRLLTRGSDRCCKNGPLLRPNFIFYLLPTPAFRLRWHGGFSLCFLIYATFKQEFNLLV